MNRLISKISYKRASKQSKKRIAQENRDNHNAYTYTPSKRMVNVVIGVGCVGYGAVTICLPTGSIWAIMLGLFLISCPISIKSLLKGLYKDIKYWVGVRW